MATGLFVLSSIIGAISVAFLDRTIDSSLAEFANMRGTACAYSGYRSVLPAQLDYRPRLDDYQHPEHNDIAACAAALLRGDVDAVIFK